jgi:translation initiation factor 4G
MSNANQFALLNDANEAADSTEAGPQRQRQRLNLAPRTVPVDGEGGDAAAAAEGEGEDAAEGSEDQDGESSAESDEVSTPKPMTETAAKAKIDLDMTELWGEKDSGGSRNPDDIVHYFRALPEHHRPLLSSKLYDEVFRTAKLKDAEIVAKGLASAVGEGAASSEIVKKG